MRKPGLPNFHSPRYFSTISRPRTESIQTGPWAKPSLSSIYWLKISPLLFPLLKSSSLKTSHPERIFNPIFLLCHKAFPESSQRKLKSSFWIPYPLCISHYLTYYSFTVLFPSLSSYTENSFSAWIFAISSARRSSQQMLTTRQRKVEQLNQSWVEETYL